MRLRGRGAGNYHLVTSESMVHRSDGEKLRLTSTVSAVLH
jgi:hypothetical protein